ncbi:hypothetical protein KIW84_055756, partial [Lathyrus oleraceus]
KSQSLQHKSFSLIHISTVIFNSAFSSSLLRIFTMASSATTVNIFSFLFVVVFAAVASAQDLSPSLAPAPGPDAGAAGSVTNSVAMIGASIVLSMLAIFKN